MSAQPVSKPQPTLTGFTAWAFDRLVEIKGQSAATVAAQIIDDWFEYSREKIEKRWEIRFDDWKEWLRQQKEVEERNSKIREFRKPSA